jgi:hypothetical protein
VAVLALKLLLAPAFVVLASLCARRFGPRIGGLVGGLPVVAGPILLILAITHGRDFGAGSARASLLGLVSLAGFVVVYAFLCRRWEWTVALPVGWGGFLVCTAMLSGVSPPVGLSLALALTSFLVALAIVPRPRGGVLAGTPPAWDLPLRALAAAAMVVTLTAVSSTLGAHLSGLLAPFPIVTSVLAAFTHAQRGAEETLALLRGMLIGFFAFALFCTTAAIALPAVSTGVAFTLAAAVALATQATALVVRR